MGAMFELLFLIIYSFSMFSFDLTFSLILVYFRQKWLYLHLSMIAIFATNQFSRQMLATPSQQSKFQAPYDI